MGLFTAEGAGISGRDAILRNSMRRNTSATYLFVIFKKSNVVDDSHFNKTSVNLHKDFFENIYVLMNN